MIIICRLALPAPIAGYRLAQVAVAQNITPVQNNANHDLKINGLDYILWPARSD